MSEETRPRSRWIDPPRLRSVENPGEERGATWTELFFDLVFVVAVAQLSSAFLEEVTVRGFLVLAGLFVPLWWAWVGFTFYADRFDTDDAIHRTFMLGGMFCVGAMAAAIPEAFSGANTTAFALAYVATRVIAVALHGRAWIHLPRARPLLDVYLVAFTVALGLWVASLAFPAPVRYWLWGAGLLIELGTPLAARGRQHVAPVDTSHVPERVGLFTIIVLGETVLAVVLGTDKVDWSAETILVGLLGFAIAAAFWWLYFDFVDTRVVGRSVLGGQVYLYAHLPLVIGLTTIGPGVKLALVDVPGGTAGDATRWVLGGGVALAYAALGVVYVASAMERRVLVPAIRFGTAAAALLLAGLGDGLQPVALLALLDVLLVGQVLVAMAVHGRPLGAPV